MPSIVRSIYLRQIGAILVIPLILASIGLGCSKATDQQPVAETANNSAVLAISTEPTSIEVVAPAPATFTVAATGTNLTYQWQRDGVDINATDNASATTEAFTLETTAATDTGAIFKVIVKDSTGQTVTSSEATLTVTDGTTPTSKPVINSFAPDNATISAGSSANLTWDVTGATNLSIDKLGTVTGTTVPVTPTVTTIYVLTASNSFGSVTMPTTITVGDSTTPGAEAPVITSFTASSSSVSAGRPVKLSWVVSNASSLSIDGIGPVAGDYISITPTAATTTYTLTATNASGSATKTAVVNVASVELPVIDSFATSAPVIGIGKSSMLAWQVENATSITIDNGVGTVTSKNRISIKPVATTTYTMTATNEAGSVTATVTIYIDETKGKKNHKNYHRSHYYVPYYHQYHYPWGVYYGW